MSLASPVLEWQDRALCRDMDPDIFFPEVVSVVLVRRAQAICAQCPVREQCEAHALSWPEIYGIWGGRWMGGRSERRNLGLYNTHLGR